MPNAIRITSASLLAVALTVAPAPAASPPPDPDAARESPGGAQGPDLGRWRLSRHGFGRLTVGLTRAEIERRAGRRLRFVYNTGSCAIWNFRGARGLSVMTTRGRLARVYIGADPGAPASVSASATPRAPCAAAIRAFAPSPMPTTPTVSI